ncbi:MAG: AsmA family protein [Dysgonamonadaceae bacterium]|jgi:hypothetical protein|nr:AsmA family protein [Dysgonamonadaceae bacterium]
MKRILKVTGIVLAVLIVLLLVLPFVFKGKILEVVKKEINENVNAKVDFEKFGLNFFKNFPNATVSLDRFYVAGTEEFESDTLVSAGHLSASVNLKSLFGKSGFEITKITINHARVHAVVNADGKANWDIMKGDDQPKEEKQDSSAFKLSLKKLTIAHSDILYDDFSSGMVAALNDLNLNLSGDFSGDETDIKTQFDIAALSFIMDKIPYLSDAHINANLNIAADLKNSKFTLAENTIQLNEIKAAIEGWLSMAEDGKMDMDLKLNTPAIQFKDVLSLIPAIYANDFKDLKTAGEATLSAYAKGVMQDSILPSFDVKLAVANAMFQYPALPQSVTNIQADLRAYNEGGTADKTILDIPRFHFDMAGNPFDMKLHLQTPVSDPNIDFSAVGKLDLNRVKDIYPLDMPLSGRLDANLTLSTLMSYIEKEQFEKVQANGTLRISDMSVQPDSSMTVQIENAGLAFSPRYVDLSAFSAKIGKNDIAANGKLENFIPYFLKDGVLRGNLTVSSNYLNLNDFMTSKTGETASDTSSAGIIEIPKNLNFILNGRFKQVIFDNLNIADAAGQITVKDGKAEMKNLSLNALGGKLTVNGSYDTGKNPQQPDVDLNLNIQEASFRETFKTFVTIQKLAPVFENMLGNYSTQFQLRSALGSDFMPVLTSLTANGLLQSNNVEVSGLTVLDGLASALKNESLKELKIKDLKLPFSISDGQVTTKPFDVKFGGNTMNLSGSTGLDQTIHYTAKVNLAGNLANQYLKNVNVNIGGTFTKPTFNVDMKDIANQALDQLAGSILGGQGTAKEQVTEKVTEQIDKQAENIRKQAKDAGDKLVAEAEKQGQKLIDEANKTSNPLAKIAAVKTAEAGAKKLKDEAQKKADQLNVEAEKQIEALKAKI